MTDQGLATLLAELDAAYEKMTPGKMFPIRVADATTPEAMLEAMRISIEASPGSEMFGININGNPDTVELGPDEKCVAYTGNGPTSKANAIGIVALVNAYPRLREELAQTIETQRHMNTVLRPLVEELRKAAHQARGREIAAVAERDALRALIDKAGRHWLALDPGVPWEGAIDAAMEAVCGEIQRLRTLVEQQREALRIVLNRAEQLFASDRPPPRACGRCGTPSAACDGDCADHVYIAQDLWKARAVLAAEVP